MLNINKRLNINIYIHNASNFTKYKTCDLRFITIHNSDLEKQFWIQFTFNNLVNAYVSMVR